MILTAGKINTVKFDAKMIERFNGKNNLQIASLKIQHEPLKIYYYQHHPTEGIEILYCKGINKNKALVKPNQFPWVNLLLDPYDRNLRTRQHHVLLEPGFAYFLKVMKNHTDNYKGNLSEIIKYLGEEVFDNNKCYKIRIDNPDFGYVKYIVKENENVDSIAEKFLINAYMILEINNLKNYDDLKPGQQIIIPNSYSKNIVLYIDKTRYIPLKMVIFDDKGLFEMYEFYNMQVNVSFKPNEFSSDFKDYGF